MKLTWATRTLETRWAWRIARGAFSQIEYTYLTLEHDGITGRGEAAHNSRYDESLESIQTFIELARPLLETCDPGHYAPLIDQIHQLAPGQHAAKAALDIALLDWVGQRLGIPLYQLWGLDPANTPLTSFSLGIDEEAILVKKLAEAEAYPILKVKLGSPDDDAIIRTVRKHTDKPLRIDANEGWTDRELALDRIAMLSEANVEFVEQPMPSKCLDDVRWLRKRAALPLVADEDVTHANDLAALATAYDGVNLKVMKVGGLQATLQMIHTARSLGLKIMLGCMIESSLGITAAAHLAPLVDWADLDGSLLLRDDPFSGVQFEGGQMQLPDRPGLGVSQA
ncbi:MAG: L-alanine-DL-glutamate epimerase-like enolase superfamily enzyme [Verrucomicrobiales bacterium]|jgi:L-alanine-DL-glutamate epimerase-like enolase superfamily enzyme